MHFETSMGRIRDIYKIVQPSAIVQGESAKGCHDVSGYTGGNGTYAVWGTQTINLWVKATIYADNCWHYIDIRDEVLDRTGWDKLTKQRIERLRDANVGKKVLFERWGNGEWQFADLDELDFDV